MNSNLRKGVTSSVLLVASAFAQKLVGLVSTLILARVLMPEDFGIVAIASLMVGFIEILSNTGSAQYLLRVDDLDKEKVDTAWTINLIIKSSMSFIMLIASFFIAQLYGDPRLTPVLISLTLVFFLYSFYSPGVIFLKRTQNYSKLVKLTIITKFFSVTAAVTAALLLKSYWALVIGQAINALLMIIGTHIIYPYKLRLRLSNAAEQWKFSGWMIPQSIFGYCRSQLDTFLISSSFGPATLGSYHTMKYIAFIPSLQIIQPISEPFLVELANIKNTGAYFTKQFKASFLLLMMIALPISALMYKHHNSITALLLGDNWVEYSYLMAAFGLLVPAFVMLGHASRALLVYGKTKQLFFYQCLSFTVVYGTIIQIGMSEIKLFAFALSGMENIVTFCFFYFILIRYTGFKSALSFLISVMPLFLSVFLAQFASGYWTSINVGTFVKLVCITATFFVVFLLVIFLCYVLGFKRFNEWRYLQELISRSLKPIVSKVLS